MFLTEDSAWNVKTEAPKTDTKQYQYDANLGTNLRTVVEQ